MKLILSLKFLHSLVLAVVWSQSSNELCVFNLKTEHPSPDTGWGCFGTIVIPTTTTEGYLDIRTLGKRFKALLRRRDSIPEARNYFTGSGSDFKVSGSLTSGNELHLTIRSVRGYYFVDGRSADEHRFLGVASRHANLLQELCPVLENTLECLKRFERTRFCGVQLVADHTFYKYMASNEANVVHVMEDHLRKAATWLKSLDSDRNRLRFKIINITIWKKPLPGFEDNATEWTLLNTFNRLVDTKSCVALLFVHRPMNVTLGISRTGGVCHERSAVISSLRGDGHSLLPNLLSTTVAHELGHLFGSGHDPTSNLCTPLDGYFLMYASLVYPEKVNNFRFSPCSWKDIITNLRQKGNCLTKLPPKSRCGNGVLEEGEECDAGSNPCCSGDCRLIPGSYCTPLNEPCCSERCEFVPRHQRRVCSLPTDECRHLALCDGKRSGCPLGKPLPDGTTCESTSKTCRHGKCISTVCEDHFLRNCVCNSPEEECFVCCQKDTSGPCLPAYSFGFKTPTGHNFTRYHRTTCAQGIAFCDRDGVCQV